MLDVFNIPGQQDNVKIFYAAGTTAWQTWTKPRNCKFIWMMCIGGGAGGSGGTGGFANQAGGTGGGSGAIVRALFPANVLPDTLYVQPGNGGGGGGGLTNATNLALAAGGSGNRSWVSISQVTSSAMNVVCVSGATAAGGGGLAGGTAETIITGNTQAGLLNLGSFSATAGQVGGASQASITPLTTIITSGGAGGGSSQATVETGGSIIATSISPLIAGGAITANGNHGIISWKPLYFLGGAGGGGNSAGGTTGNGGNGAYGCGGGAGGSNTGNPGGNGGNGGDGLVIIATF
jgi:hypothetical protein